MTGCELVKVSTLWQFQVNKVHARVETGTSEVILPRTSIAVYPIKTRENASVGTVNAAGEVGESHGLRETKSSCFDNNK